ncbi:hypothetical protein HYV73_04880 [Candidatus Uhrbacteria bacterium]|nr:hypothetical protein [Candidatus Uhrbacteria bacterium]
MKYLSFFLLSLSLLPLSASATSEPLSQRLRGHILLQVEQHGEAWYVHPSTGARYYLKDGPTAYEMMRAFGLGITDADLARLQAGDKALISSLKGKILLQVQQHGEAFYVDPDTGEAYYMKDGDAAYQLMRFHSLGIKTADLLTIQEEIFVPLPSEPSQTEEQTSKTTEPHAKVDIRLAPAGIDTDELNAYWISKINALRAGRGLSQLSVRDELRVTGTAYAQELKNTATFTHTRQSGQSLLSWMQEWGAPLVPAPEGAVSQSVAAENIAQNEAVLSMAGVKAALDQNLQMMLDEESWDGPHYQAIYHANWNGGGVGFVFTGPIHSGKYEVLAVIHYGLLAD